MIKSFSHKGLEDFFYDGTKKGIQPKHASKLEDILDRLNQAREIRDMDYQVQIFILYCPSKRADGRSRFLVIGESLLRSKKAMPTKWIMKTTTKGIIREV